MPNVLEYIGPIFSCGIDLWKCQFSDFTLKILIVICVVILSEMLVVYGYECHFHFNFDFSKILD